MPGVHLRAVDLFVKDKEKISSWNDYKKWKRYRIW
jgi:hypothetical protein